MTNNMYLINFKIFCYSVTESLLYPDFSVIALYKNLIIGFGFMVPDISTNENYITFLFTRPHWTNCGIAKFMIYHLIQVLY